MFKELFVFSVIYIIIRTILWYRRRIRIFKTFSKNGIKGPKPSLISGNFYDFKDNPNDTFNEWIQRYGNVFGYFLGGRPVLVINDLDSIQEIFVKKSKQFRDRPKFALNVKPLISSLIALRGDRWRHVRRVMTPSLTHHKMTSKEITDILIESIDKSIGKIEEQKDNVVKVEDRMQSITLDIVCKCVLNMYDTDVHEEDSQLKKAAKEYMESAKNVVVVFAHFFPFIKPVLTFINNYLTAGRMTDSILKHLNKQIQIEKQKIELDSGNREKTKNNTVLSSLMKSYFQNDLEKDEVMGNAIVLLLAGYDTTSMGLTSALFCLAKNQEIQERLRYEVKSEGYNSQYVDMVWNETLRLFPPVATFVQREASEDVVINDIVIEKGTTIQVPIWYIQHNPDVWPEPDKFDPQRFSLEHREDRHSASFLAFGLGQKHCIGIELAAHEARLTLSRIIEKFRIETCDQTPDDIQFYCPTDILYPKNPIYLRFIRFNDSEIEKN